MSLSSVELRQVSPGAVTGEAGECPVIRSRGGGPGGPERGGFAGSTGVVAAQGVDGPPVRLHRQEGAERTSSRVEALGLVPETKEDILHHVVGVALPAQAASLLLYVAAVTAVGLGQGIVGAAGDAPHQPSVAELRNILVRGGFEHRRPLVAIAVPRQIVHVTGSSSE